MNTAHFAPYPGDRGSKFPGTGESLPLSTYGFDKTNGLGVYMDPDTSETFFQPAENGTSLIIDLEKNQAVNFLKAAEPEFRNELAKYMNGSLFMSRIALKEYERWQMGVKAVENPEEFDALLGRIQSTLQSSRATMQNIYEWTGQPDSDVLKAALSVHMGAYCADEHFASQASQNSDEAHILSASEALKRQLPAGHSFSDEVIKGISIRADAIAERFLADSTVTYEDVEKLGADSALLITELEVQRVRTIVAMQFHLLMKMTMGTNLASMPGLPKTMEMAKAVLATEDTSRPAQNYSNYRKALQSLDDLIAEATTKLRHGEPYYTAVKRLRRKDGVPVERLGFQIDPAAKRLNIDDAIRVRNSYNAFMISHVSRSTQYMVGLIKSYMDDGVSNPETKVLIDASATIEDSVSEKNDHNIALTELNQFLTAISKSMLPFNPTSKAMRKEGLVGRESLEDKLRQLRNMNGHVEPAVKTYAGLKMLAEQLRDDVHEFLADLLQTDTEMRTNYANTISALPYALRPGERLPRDIREDIEWLTTHWTEFCSAAKSSTHTVSDEMLEKIYMLMMEEKVEETSSSETPETAVVDSLGSVVMTEATTDEVLSEQASEWTPKELEELAELERTEVENLVVDALGSVAETARAVHEAKAALNAIDEEALQLNWVIFPPDKPIEVKDLEGHVKAAFASKQRGEPKICHDRLDDLLFFREMYDGTLYRSDERYLGDPNNLYFVLRFAYKGKNFAWAENPVKGNGTFIFREDLLPLVEGETVLTVLKSLSRKDIRDAGLTRMMRHDDRSSLSHADRIQNRLDTLACMDPTI